MAEAQSTCSPWRRWGARLLDISLFSFPGGFIVGLLFPSWFVGDGWLADNQLLAGVAIAPVALIIEGIVFAVFKSTPGKAIAGISFSTIDGSGLSAGQYANRLLNMYFFGAGLGIPIVSMFTALTAYNQIKRDGDTTYDTRLNIRCRAPDGAGRTALTISLAFFTYMTVFVISQAIGELAKG
jgi:hypothetical protein